MNIYNLLPIIFFVFSFASCNEEKSIQENEEQQKPRKELIVREQSEMAALMLQMYSFNEKLKKQIKNQETISDFPEQFSNIHEAVLTEGKTRGSNFSKLSDDYLEAQRMIHDSSLDKKEAFNNMVASCVDCHKQKCTGPIPKIEKLYLDVD